MKYNIEIYEKTSDNTARFILGSMLEKPLIVVGLNPSTADEKTPDRTINRVMGFAEGNGFDSFIVLNLYPQRATYPNDLHLEMDENLFSQNIEEISKLLNSRESFVILASWSEKIKLRKYFTDCIKAIYILSKDYNIKWNKIGELTKTGHPRHPLYAPYASGFTDFNIEDYIRKLK